MSLGASPMQISPLFWRTNPASEPEKKQPVKKGPPSQDNPESFQQYESLLGRPATESERKAYDQKLTEDPRNYESILDEAIGVKRAETTERLTSQILNQGTTSQWSGEGFGSARENAKAMASKLVSAGIENLEDFGRRAIQESKTYHPELRDAGWLGSSNIPKNPNNTVQPVYDPTSEAVIGYREFAPTGRWFESVTVNDESFGSYESQQFLSPEQISQLKLSGTKPVNLMQDTNSTEYINKKTGEVINPEYAFAGGNVWGGTFAGDGRTSFGVQFAENGTPYFYTQYGGSSSDWESIAPLVGIGLMFIPGLQGVGASIGAAVAPSVSAATQALIGNAIVQGALAEAQGGDFLKAAALSAAGSAAGSFAGDVGAKLGITDTALAKVVGSAVITGSASAVTGGDFITGAVSGALSAGAGQMVGETIGLDGRVASTVGTSLVQGVVAELQGKDVSDAMIAGAISGALTYKDQPKPEESGITKRVVDEAIPQGYVPPDEDFDISQIGAGFDFKADYSLTGGITFPRTEGLKVDPITGSGSTVGYSPVDYGFNVKAPFEGLQMPTSPNITGMGGGQGITVKTPEGELSESGVTKTGTAFDLGDPDSFINKPAPDVPDKAPIDTSKIIDAGVKLLGTAAVGTAVSSTVRPSATLAPVNLEYGDIYRDAPIKGFAMRKGADGRYKPFIGEKAQLAKGGLVSRRN